MIRFLKKSWNFNRLFLKLNQFIYNYQPVLPIHCLGVKWVSIYIVS